METAVTLDSVLLLPEIRKENDMNETKSEKERLFMRKGCGRRSWLPDKKMLKKAIL